MNTIIFHELILHMRDEEKIKHPAFQAPLFIQRGEFESQNMNEHFPSSYEEGWP
jgi:hypothetical protein